MNPAEVVYIYGDETFLVDRALAELEKNALVGGDPCLNRQVFEAPDASPADVIAAAKTLPFLGTRRLVVVRNADRWSADDWKRFIPYLESPNPSTCLVFVASQLDRRLKAGKLIAERARLVECRKPSERNFFGWAKRLAADAHLRVDPRILEVLVARVDRDLQLLSREIEKLRAFAGKGGTLEAADAEALVGDSRGTNVFVLCNSMGQKDLNGAVRALRKLLQLGEPPAKLLYMVVRHFRHLWIGRELLDAGGPTNLKNAASLMGVPPFAAEKIVSQARRWSVEGLRRAFRLFVRADLSLKTGGGEEVLDGILLRLCRSPNDARPGVGRGAERTHGGWDAHR